jgi:amino acid adenylation domain-containing protein
VSRAQGGSQASLEQLSPAKRALLELRLARAQASADGRAGGPRARGAKSAPLSYAQQRLWLLDQLHPGLTAYNVGRALRLHGELDVDALAGALTELLARHEALRTAFVVEDELPVQRVLAPTPVALEATDLAAEVVGAVEPGSGVESGSGAELGSEPEVGSPGASRDERIRELIVQEVRRPFDLAAGPLLRARLWRLGEDDHLLVIGTHHIASDEGSRQVMFAELSVLYDDLRSGRPPSLAPLDLQYGDFAAWERAAGDGAALEAELGWWRARLTGAPVELDLPADRPRWAIPGYAGARLTTTLDPALLDGLRKLARAQGVTLFMVALAAFETLLMRLTGAQDMLVGTPISGRSRPELQPLVGLFANTVVLRCDLSGAPTFLELLGRVREAAVGAYAHQEVPLERLVEELAPTRELARHPLFQVLFNFLEQPGAEAPALAGLRVQAVEFDPGATKFDLALVASVRPDGLRLLWEYSSELFERESIERLSVQFRTLLEGILADPGIPVTRLALLSPAQRRELVEELNATAAPIPAGCVHELIAGQAAARAQVPAVRCGERTLTYGELEGRANRLAHALRELGVGPGALVGVYLDRSLELVVGLLGVLKAGAAYVPLDPGYPAERLAFMAQDAQLGALLTRSDLRSGAPARAGEVLCLDDPALERHPEAPPPPAAAAEDLAYVIYTSGSTGRPKGVMIEHRSLVNLLAAMIAESGLGAEDVMLALTTFSFDIAVFELLGPLMVGGSVILTSESQRADPDALLGLLGGDGGITIAQATPSTWRMLLDAGMPALADLRILCGGEALPRELADRLLARAAGVWNFYGPTETTVWSTCWKLGGPEEGVPIGRPLANTRCYVLDPSGEPVPLGTPGELNIAGAGVARGYHARAELTAERFPSDPFHPGEQMYRTGDLVRMRPDGALEFKGRLDHQVKLRGFRVELGEIEATLAEHPGVRQVLAHVREDTPGDQRLVAYVVGDAPIEELQALAVRALPEYMVPSAFLMLAALPTTPNGKVDRGALPAPRRGGDAERVAPGTELERRLAALWAEVLGATEPGVHESFFALGGHSLAAVRLIAKANAALGVCLPMRALFEAPTIAQLAALIQARPAAAPHERADADADADAAVSADSSQAPYPKVVPASSQQARLWFLDRLQPGQSVYNIPLCLRIAGPLDIGALRHALDRLAARHDALRVTLIERDGAPMQLVGAPGPFPLEQIEASSAAEGTALALAEAARPFDLIAGPLARGVLIEIASDEHILALTFHHAVADGWSLNLLADELGALYRRPVKLAPPELQYSDYAETQRRMRDTGAQEATLAWWRERLAGAPAELELPNDRPRAAHLTGAGARHVKTLDGETLHGIVRLAGAHDVTPFMVLLAAFSVLLARYGGQDEIVVGTPSSGRPQPELESVFGYLANTLVLRTDLAGDPTFTELLARVRETVLGAYAHQEVQFDRLVEELAPARELARHPLFQVLIALQDDRSPTPLLDGATCEVLDIDRGVSRFDLSVSFARRDGALRVAWEYSSELFDERTIVGLSAHLENLLEGILADPARAISRLTLLSTGERRELLEGQVGAPTAAPPGCAHELIAAQAARSPDAVAVRCAGRALSYGELEARANRVAHELRELGVAPGQLVGLHLGRSVELLVGLLAVLKAGGAYVPLDPAYPSERLELMARDAGLRVLVTHGDLRERAPQAQSVVCVDDPRLERHPASAPPCEARPEDLAYVIYTSGSTGRPKGVMVEHRNLVNLLASMAERPGLQAGETMLGLTTPAFDLSVPDLYLPLFTGASLLLAQPHESVDPRALATLLDEGQVTVMQATPSTWRMLIEDGWRPSRPMRVVIGGEAVSPLLAARLCELVDEVWNFYGPTETTVWSTCWRLGGPEEGVPIGRPLANTSCYVLDPHGEPVPAGVRGELYIGGAGVARGYHARAELTAERFLADPFQPGGRMYRTGDLVRVRADGLLQFEGRGDDQVKLRGFRIELGEIETTLAEHPGVGQVLACVREDTPGDQRLVAYHVGDVAIDELRELAQRRLPAHMVPGAFVALDELPLTPNGKLDRTALPAPRAGAVATLAPRTPLEQQLASLWSEVLGTDGIGVHDSFFALGGHSLLVTKMLARLREALGVEVPLRGVYESPTIAELARLVGAALIEAEGLDELELLLAELEQLPEDGVSEAP